MENIELKHAIKNIYSPIALILNAILTLLLIRFFLLRLHDIPSTVLLLFYIGIEVMFWKKFLEFCKKPAELLLLSQSLKIYDQEILPHQIDRIIIMGYFFQKAGIKFVNKRVISSLHSFRMDGDADEVIMDIKEWSKRNGVKVERGHFSVWF